MTELRWRTYLSLQTVLAYGEGLSTSDPSEAQADHGREWFTATNGAGHLLVVGPGRLGEIARLQSCASYIHALAAHGPEIDHLRAGGVDARAGDIHAMPFDSGTFDTLYASNVLEHTLAPYVALMECRRVLKDNGRAYFIMPGFAGDQGGSGAFHLHCLDRLVWLELLHKTGFRVSGEQSTLYVDGVTTYHHFFGTAVEPPEPHATILRAVRTLPLGTP